MASKILIVEDEETLCESLQRVFTKEGFEADGVHSAESALKVLEEGVHDLLITDIILPGINGIELLKKARQTQPELIVVIITAYASVETAVEALRAGAYDYVMKPIIHEEIKKIASNALTQKALLAENVMLKRQIEKTYNFDNIIGESPAIKKVINEIKKIADAKSSVLLTGDTGTGKELIARAIHHNSIRKHRPFVPVNCNAIPEHLLESELFGYVKGAFTGAANSKKGLFEEADGGTIFFDEIGEISQQLQIKLLRVLEDQEIRPLGTTQSKKVNVRIITATNRDIEKEVAEGRFRDDLFYRINVINVNLPPLRERDGDTMLLAEHFLRKYSGEIGKKIDSISDDVIKIMSSYHWPGNVREMQNIVERAVLISESNTITQANLPTGLKKGNSIVQKSDRKTLSIDEYTRTFILENQEKYSEQQLADMLGITRKTLWEKRKKWDIKR
jgi:DNA-binding NtrC family response regulator